MSEVPLTQYPKIEALFCRTASWCEACLFFRDDWFCMQHDFTWVVYQPYCAVILALLKVTFLGKGNDKRLGPWYGPLSCLTYLIADFMQGAYHCISSCLNQLPRDIGYPWRFSLLKRFHRCFDLFAQDWVVISVGYWWDNQCGCSVLRSILSTSLECLGFR